MLQAKKENQRWLHEGTQAYSQLRNRTLDKSLAGHNKCMQMIFQTSKDDEMSSKIKRMLSAGNVNKIVTPNGSKTIFKPSYPIKIGSD